MFNAMPGGASCCCLFQLCPGRLGLPAWTLGMFRKAWCSVCRAGTISAYRVLLFGYLVLCFVSFCFRVGPGLFVEQHRNRNRIKTKSNIDSKYKNTKSKSNKIELEKSKPKTTSTHRRNTNQININANTQINTKSKPVKLNPKQL